MPVSIPGYAKVGDGLQIPRLDMTLRTASAGASGLPRDAFREAEQLLAAFVDSKVFPGAALIVGYRGAIVLDAAVGKLDYTRSSARTSQDTIYDLASVTKAVSTTSAAMMLTESGRLLLHAPVQDYLPEFRGTGKERVLVQHLLSHSSGLPSRARIYLEARGYNEVFGRVCAAPLEYPPGTKAQYSDLGMILLGEIIQRAAGRPLDQLVKESLFAPLGMSSTGYRPGKSLIRRIAPTENDPWRKRVVRGEVHDENAFAMGGVAGHAGLFSSARDLAIFAQMMLNGGMYDHRRCFSPSTIARFTAREIGNRALGWGKPTDADWTGQTFSPQAYGHSGFTGTSIWIDPQRQMFMILLANRVHPTRDPDRMPEVRQAISEAVVRALPPAAEAGSH
jgi:CubicO group peptidase (beta-lactamase class C family)